MIPPSRQFGIPATSELCQELVAAGGTIANIGVHGRKVDLHLEELWDRNISITARLVDTITVPMLFKTVGSKKIDPGFDLGGAVTDATAGSGLGLGDDAAENQKDRRLPGRRPKNKVDLPALVEQA